MWRSDEDASPIPFHSKNKYAPMRNRCTFPSWSTALIVLVSLGLVAVAAVASSWVLQGGASKAWGSGLPFEYKEIYLPPLDPSDSQELCLNNLDTDWGLWGHNLHKTLPTKPDRSVFALVGGKRNEEQFCFSSDVLRAYVEAYILENYGEEARTRFAIFPADNDVVCQCAACQGTGNTTKDASPSILAFVEQLAGRFPRHLFFTSHYGVARGIPAGPMPANVGVMVSAMDYPLCARSTREEADFRSRLNAWAAVTHHVYVWDYICNFDDYMTPYPIFSIMQRRLRLYAEAGVKGVFLNGSGEDYSTLSDVKTLVLAELLQNPDADWRRRLREVCRRRYPSAGDVVARFMLEQEAWAVRRGARLPLYGGIGEALDSYLPEAELTNFHDAIGACEVQATGDEQRALGRLRRALLFTRLELLRHHGRAGGGAQLLSELERLASEGVETYSEAAWTLRGYAADYRRMLQLGKEAAQGNVLRGVGLQAVTQPDEGYDRLEVLTDGFTGLPSNYHCGWLISSARPVFELRIPLGRVGRLRQLRVYMAENKAFRMGLPDRVELSVSGNQVDVAVPERMADGHAHCSLFVPAHFQAKPDDSLTLTFVAGGERTMAIGEIAGYNSIN